MSLAAGGDGQSRGIEGGDGAGEGLQARPHAKEITQLFVAEPGLYAEQILYAAATFEEGDAAFAADKNGRGGFEGEEGKQVVGNTCADAGLGDDVGSRVALTRLRGEDRRNFPFLTGVRDGFWFFAGLQIAETVADAGAEL